jgi:hypothetical protein
VEAPFVPNVAFADCISSADDVVTQTQAIEQLSSRRMAIDEGPWPGFCNPPIRTVGLNDPTQSPGCLQKADSGIWPLVGDVQSCGET